MPDELTNQNAPQLGGDLTNEKTETAAPQPEENAANAPANETTAATEQAAADGKEPALGKLGEDAEEHPDAKQGEEQQPAVDYTAIKLPDGYELTPEISEQLTPVLSSMHATQDQAQQLADLHCKLMNQAIQDYHNHISEMVSGWSKELKTDPEIGGAKLAENLSYGNKLLKEFGSPQLIQFMADSNLNVQPDVVKFLCKVGKALSEDRFVDSSQRGASQRNIDTVAQNLFSKSLGGK